MPRLSELQLRILSAIVLLPVGTAFIWFGGLPLSVMMSAVAAGLVHEWLRLAMPEHDRRLGLTCIVLVGLSVLGLAHGALIPEDYRHIPTAFPVLAILCAWMSGPRGQRGYPIAVLGIIYILFAILGLVLLRQEQSGFAAFISIVAIVVATDIGAFFVGRAIGGPKLAPKVSPGKTWSGAIGGVAAACAALAGLQFALSNEAPEIPLIALGALLSAASQVGDLMESALKRRAGVKDSGKIIPGHGGLLDRFDGFLAAALMLFILKLAGVEVSLAGAGP